jgi:hypothetical protein
MVNSFLTKLVEALARHRAIPRHAGAGRLPVAALSKEISQ